MEKIITWINSADLILQIYSLLWVCSEIFISISKRAKLDDETKIKDKKSFWMLWGVFLTSLVIGISFKEIFKIGDFSDSSISIVIWGIFIAMIGNVIRYVSMYTLRKSFTVNVAIKKDQKLITTGIYKYFRHPSYVGMVIAILAFGFALRNWISLIIVLVPVSIVLIFRVIIEEKALIEHFEKDYIDYKLRQIKKQRNIILKISATICFLLLFVIIPLNIIKFTNISFSSYAPIHDQYITYDFNGLVSNLTLIGNIIFTSFIVITGVYFLMNFIIVKRALNRSF